MKPNKRLDKKAEANVIDSEELFKAWQHLPVESKPRIDANGRVTYEVRDSMSSGTFRESFEAYKSRQKVLRLELDARRAVGRYILDEAALILETEAGLNARDVIDKLVAATEADELPIYLSGRNDNLRKVEVRYFYHEAFWDDLNKWMNAKLPRVAWRFPDPNAGAGSPPSPLISGLRWTKENREELRREHIAEKVAGNRQPTKTLAEKYGISGTRIRQLKELPGKKSGSIADTITSASKRK